MYILSCTIMTLTLDQNIQTVLTIDLKCPDLQRATLLAMTNELTFKLVEFILHLTMKECM